MDMIPTGVVSTKSQDGSARMRRLSVLPATLSLVLALPGTASAFDLDYTLGATILHSDNINLSEFTPDAETVISPQIDFKADQVGSTLELKARGALQYLDYQGDNYKSEFRGDFAGQMRWHMLPQRLDFVVEDYLSQQPIDITTGLTPTNSQQVNVLNLGPSLLLRFGERMRGQLDLRYANTYAEESKEFNGNRYSVGAHLFRQLAPLKSLSFNLEGAQVNYDDALLDADYRRYDAYVGYKSESKRLSMDLTGGYTRIQLDDNAKPDLNGPLFRGELDWSLSARSSLNANLGYQFSDTALDAVLYNTDSQGPVIHDVGTLNPLVGVELYRMRRVEAGYRYSGPRLDFQVRPFYQRASYPYLSLSNWHGNGVDIGGSYRLQPLLSLHFLVASTTRDYASIDRRDKDLILRAGLTKQFSRHWSASADLQRRKRDSDIAGQNFTENLASVTVSYRR